MKLNSALSLYAFALKDKDNNKGKKIIDPTSYFILIYGCSYYESYKLIDKPKTIRGIRQREKSPCPGA
jgi:hypothetical protein